jgi:hypothetical protein
VKNKFNCFFEGYTFAFLTAAVVEVMVSFVFEPNVEFLEYTAFLAKYEAF